jgi:PAS domain S-box-containing protein
LGGDKLDELRRKVEDLLQERKGALMDSASGKNINDLLHELRVHQVELEMQNAKLLVARAAAEEAADKYSDLFDFAPIGYFVWDLKGRILEVNLAGAAMLGLSRSRAVDKHFSQYVAEEDRDQFYNFCKQAALAETKESCEIRIHGKEYPISVLVEAISGGDRPEPKIRAAVIDITQQKRADELAAAVAGLKKSEQSLARSEERYRILSENLEKRVEERTRELEQRTLQLRQLTAELTFSEQRERQRLALLLHDGLQQLLVAAKYQVARLERGGDIRSVAADISNLIDDSIETSRSLTAELSPPILHQGGLLPALEWLANWMHGKHGLSVSMIIREQVGRLPEETTLLLFQAVRELLFNVVKHAGVRTARVEVAKQDGRVQVEVADEGSGFDLQRLQSEREKNEGIGLFSIRERFGYLGGSMEIDSAPGKGSRFRLFAPADRAEEESPKSPAGIKHHVSYGLVQPEIGSFNEIRVVLVDDHMVVRQGLAGLLRSESDITVVGEASDGESAIDIVRRTRPDVVLMDISMPGMDGIEATRIIHRELGNVSIIGLSMFREDERTAAMREAGAVGYLTKSAPSEAVIETIRSYARKRSN